MIRYAVTYINKDDMRTLAFANQGRHHYDTAEAAQAWIDLVKKNQPQVVKELFRDSLEVRSVECHDHGDAIGIYFD